MLWLLLTFTQAKVVGYFLCLGTEGKEANLREIQAFPVALSVFLTSSCLLPIRGEPQLCWYWCLLWNSMKLDKNLCSSKCGWQGWLMSFSNWVNFQMSLFKMQLAQGVYNMSRELLSGVRKALVVEVYRRCCLDPPDASLPCPLFVTGSGGKCSHLDSWRNNLIIRCTVCFI